jgi:hypothetical protein
LLQQSRNARRQPPDRSASLGSVALIRTIRVSSARSSCKREQSQAPMAQSLSLAGRNGVAARAERLLRAAE